MTKLTLNEVPVLTLAPGINARIVTAESMTIAHVRLEAGAKLPEHSHVHEQVVNVIDGEIELVVSGVPHTLTSGAVFILASNVPHSANVKLDSYVIDVFHPVREDFRAVKFSGYTGTR